MSEFEITLKKLPAKTVVGKEFTGPYWDSSAIFADVYLWSIANKNLVKGNVYGFFYDNPKEVVPEKCRSYAAIELNDLNAILPDGFVKKSLPETEAAAILFKGPYYAKEKYKAYAALKYWLDENPDYKLEGSLLIEEYLNTPADTQENDLLTLIIMPVVKK